MVAVLDERGASSLAEMLCRRLRFLSGSAEHQTRPANAESADNLRDAFGQILPKEEDVLGLRVADLQSQNNDLLDYL